MKITDRIKPIGLNSVGFLKNFRGEVTIDLKDVKTGEVETYHDHNLVTKALAYFLKQGGLTNPTAFNASALRTDFLHYMLGGMMCLDTAITDAGGHDDEIVRVPAGVKMTANGAYNVVNTGNPPELGSWNELESGWQNDGSYKMVWDFTTSQGNGTIATVCLSSLMGGYKGIGNLSNTAKYTNIATIDTYNSGWAKGVGDNPNILGYNANTVHVYNHYQGRLNDSTSETVDKMIINEYAYPFTDIDVRDGIEARLLNTYEVTIPSPLHGKGASLVYAVMDSYCKNGIAYILVGGYYNPTNPTIASEIYVLKYNLATHAFTACIALTGQGSNNNIWGISDKYVIIGKEAIEFDNPAHTIDLVDGSDIVTTVYDGTYGTMKALDSDSFEGVYSKSGTSYILHIDCAQSKIYQCNGSGQTIGGCGATPTNDLLRINSMVYRDPRYIATIFNLDSAKTKSADKTMKVTYVLRFNAEEEE